MIKIKIKFDKPKNETNVQKSPKRKDARTFGSMLFETIRCT